MLHRRRLRVKGWKKPWLRYVLFLRFNRETLDPGVTRVRLAYSYPFTDVLHVVRRKVRQCRHVLYDEHGSYGWHCTKTDGHTDEHYSVFDRVSWTSEVA